MLTPSTCAQRGLVSSNSSTEMSNDEGILWYDFASTSYMLYNGVHKDRKTLKLIKLQYMSVEDIDYLKENSENDSCILYIDSAQRDRSKFAHPSSYVVSFDQPFKYVFGVDVLDASIPSTMFNIDVANNIVRSGNYDIVAPDYTTHDNSFSNQDGSFTTDLGKPDAPDFDAMLVELGALHGFDDIMNRDTYIEVSKPYTTRIIISTRQALTAAYRREVLQVPAVNFTQSSIALLTDENIKKLFFASIDAEFPASMLTHHVLALREAFATDQNTTILTSADLAQLTQGMSMDKVYQWPRGVFVPERILEVATDVVMNKTKLQLYLENTDIKQTTRANSCRFLSFLKISTEYTLVEYINITNIADIELEVNDARPQRTTYFEFVSNDDKYYIKFATNWDISFQKTQGQLEFIESLIELSKSPDINLVDKLAWDVIQGFTLTKEPRSPTPYRLNKYILVPITYYGFETGGSLNGYERLVTYNMYFMVLGLQKMTLLPGNYGITNFLTEIKRAFMNSGINVENSFVEDITIRPNLRFNCATPFFFDMENSTIRTVMGFDELSMSGYEDYYIKMHYKSNQRMFRSIAVDVEPQAAAFYNNAKVIYKITSPGVIYLLGTRYCILRCEELDDHLYGSRSYGQFSPGIALFKMFNVNDVAHQRIDFVNFQKKPFHPIGRLDKLSFRFETSDGSLYDFKSANHLLILSIKYYVPSQKRGFKQSVLNPNYQKDYSKYMLGRSVEYKDQSDDEDDEQVDAFVHRLNKKQIMYNGENDSDPGYATSSSASEFDFKS